MSTILRNVEFAERDTRKLLLKWIVALLVPLLIFMFVWRGYLLVNQVLLSFFSPGSAFASPTNLVQAAFFMLMFFALAFALAGYLVAADSGRFGMVQLWIDMLAFAVLPILLISGTNNLLIGLCICAVIWAIYFPLRELST